MRARRRQSDWRPAVYVKTDRDIVVLEPELQHITSVQWFRKAKIDVYAFRSTDHPGRVSFAGDNKGAMGDDLHLDLLLDWLEQELTDPAFDADFAKINDSGCEEQHLVLRVDIGNRIPDEVTLALIDRDSILPTRPPAIPGRHLTGLWLIPEFGWSAVCWTVDDGWRRVMTERPERPPESTPAGRRELI